VSGTLEALQMQVNAVSHQSEQLRYFRPQGKSTLKMVQQAVRGRLWRGRSRGASCINFKRREAIAWPLQSKQCKNYVPGS